MRALVTVVLLLAAVPALAEPLAHCRNRFAVFDETVARAGVADAEARRIQGFPYLRVDRYAAALRQEIEDDTDFDAWVERLAVLDRQGRVVERLNLPAGLRQGVDAYVQGALDVCRDRLIGSDLADAVARQDLLRQAFVPDSYQALARVVGLFPLTVVPVSLGYQRWLAANLPAFAEPPLRPAAVGKLQRWGPGKAASLPPLAGRAVDPFGHPALTPQDLDALAHAHAPVFLIETASAADVPGRPLPGAPPGVEADHPEVFVRHAWQRGPDGPLLQLVYAIWFDARPPDGPRDLLAGALDGVMWRVTLDATGRVLVHDTIHACGCYHLAFPVPPAVRVPLPEDETLEESLPVPMAAPALASGQRLAVRLAAGSHYVSGLAAVPATRDGERRYRLVTDWAVPDRALRSVALGDGTAASLYGTDGLVAGSERLERFILWPMGVASPGAMRQWGHHATAFAGRRHFDDPGLIARHFAWPARMN